MKSNVPRGTSRLEIAPGIEQVVIGFILEEGGLANGLELGRNVLDFDGADEVVLAIQRVESRHEALEDRPIAGPGGRTGLEERSYRLRANDLGGGSNQWTGHMSPDDETAFLGQS